MLFRCTEGASSPLRHWHGRTTHLTAIVTDPIYFCVSLQSPFPQRIACAAATLFGRYGAVTRIAHEHGLGRQSVYRQTEAVRDDLDAPTHRQEVLHLRQQLEQAQARCDDLQRRLDDAVVLDP